MSSGEVFLANLGEVLSTTRVKVSLSGNPRASEKRPKPVPPLDLRPSEKLAGLPVWPALIPGRNQRASGKSLISVGSVMTCRIANRGSFIGGFGNEPEYKIQLKV